LIRPRHRAGATGEFWRITLYQQLAPSLWDIEKKHILAATCKGKEKSVETHILP
jgi:hypothetical protein